MSKKAALIITDILVSAGVGYCYGAADESPSILAIRLLCAAIARGYTHLLSARHDDPRGLAASASGIVPRQTA